MPEEAFRVAAIGVSVSPTKTSSVETEKEREGSSARSSAFDNSGWVPGIKKCIDGTSIQDEPGFVSD